MNNNSHYGAIIGDIFGSYFEAKEMFEKEKALLVPYEERTSVLKVKNINSLLTEESSLTDDSVLTLALMDATLTDFNYEEKIKQYAIKESELGIDIYGRSRFAPRFMQWANGNAEGNSWGNGCAMRISPIGYAFSTLEQTLTEAEKATKCSHNHEDSIKCAKAVAGAIFLARNNNSKEEIKVFVEQTLQMECNHNLDFLSHNYIFTSKATNSVPQALSCFFQTNSFEDCLKTTISIGGDVDTNCAISCAIAGAFYGICDTIVNETKKYISEDYQKIINLFGEKYVK